MNTALALTSYKHIDDTLTVDDQTFRELRRLGRERPGKTEAVWERGPASWRKAAYYAHDIPIVVLEHGKLRAGSAPVIAQWRGQTLEKRVEGPAPLAVTVPAGTRLVWLVNPRTEFFQTLSRSFTLIPSGPVFYTDLLGGHGARDLG